MILDEISDETTIFTIQADDGLIQYPYSTREVVNIVKHLERFPEEGLGAVVRDVAYSHKTTNYWCNQILPNLCKNKPFSRVGEVTFESIPSYIPPVIAHYVMLLLFANVT